MTETEWNAANNEERAAEFEKCKDPVYVYNTYWHMPDGSKPKPITREQYDLMVAESRDYFFNRYRKIRHQQVSLETEEAIAFNKFRVEQLKLNPATEAALNWMKKQHDELLNPEKLGIPEHLNGEPQRVIFFYDTRGIIGFRPDPNGKWLLTNNI